MKIPPNVFGAALRPFTVLCVMAPTVGLFLYLLFGMSFDASMVGISLVVLVMGCDTLARVFEYDFILRNQHLYPRRYVLPRLKRTFCGRGVAIALYGDPVRQQFRAAGYTMTDILPDDAPGCFFKLTWWRIAMGIDKKF